MHGLKLSRRSRASTVLVLLASVAIGAGGCGAPARPANTVVLASGTDLESGNPLVTVHPLSRQIQRHVLFVTLARYDSTLSPVPYAARVWTWSDDQRVLRIALVPGIRWHDGQPTTAADVAFTILAARDPATGWLRAADLAAIDTVVATDSLTAEIRFATAQTAFPLVLCELPIVPRHLLDRITRAELRRADFNIAPVGNGPFRFVDRRAGERWRFARNDAFPAALGGPPRIAGLVVAVVDEATTKFAGLAAGDLDVAGISPTMASLAARDPTLRVLDYPVLFTTGLVLNVHRPPFDDVRVRRALRVAVDRRRIVDAALAGYGVPASGPVPAENPLAAADTIAQDATLADSLLDAAGWHRVDGGPRQRDGRDFRIELLTVGSGDNAVEQLLQADLRERGIQLDIRQLELGSFLTRARAPAKTFDALVTGIPGDISLAYLVAMFESAQRGSAVDYAGFHREDLDVAFDRARRASTDTARRAAWADAQRILADASPVIWLYHSRGVQGISTRLRNVRMDLRGELVTVADWDVTGPPGRQP